MRRAWPLFVLLFVSGCETRRTYLEALNEYRVTAPTLNVLKAQRRHLPADRARDLRTAELPFFFPQFDAPGKPIKSPSAAEKAQQVREAQENNLARYAALEKSLDARIADLETKVEALKRRLRPEDLTL